MRLVAASLLLLVTAGIISSKNTKIINIMGQKYHISQLKGLQPDKTLQGITFSDNGSLQYEYLQPGWTLAAIKFDFSKYFSHRNGFSVFQHQGKLYMRKGRKVIYIEACQTLSYYTFAFDRFYDNLFISCHEIGKKVYRNIHVYGLCVSEQSIQEMMSQNVVYPMEVNFSDGHILSIACNPLNGDLAMVKMISENTTVALELKNKRVHRKLRAVDQYLNSEINTCKIKLADQFIKYKNSVQNQTDDVEVYNNPNKYIEPTMDNLKNNLFLMYVDGKKNKKGYNMNRNKNCTAELNSSAINDGQLGNITKENEDLKAEVNKLNERLGDLKEKLNFMIQGTEVVTQIYDLFSEVVSPSDLTDSQRRSFVCVPRAEVTNRQLQAETAVQINQNLMESLAFLERLAMEGEQEPELEEAAATTLIPPEMDIDVRFGDPE